MISNTFSKRKLCFLLLILPVSLLAQKKLLKKAQALERSEQHQLAAEKYMEVLYRNATKTEAIEGLKRTSQQVVNLKLSDYFTARSSGDLKAAVDTFDEIIDYQEALDYFKVTVQIPPYYLKDYANDKELLTNEIAANDKKEKALSQENQYKNAIALFENGQWAKASAQFQALGTYEQSAYYLEEINKKAVRIAIVENNLNRFSAEYKLRNSLLAEVIKLNNPLIRVVNRENLDQVVEEQKLGLTGILDEKTVAQLGQLLGVEMLLITQVVNYNFKEGESIVQDKTAYTATSRQVFDQTTQSSTSIKDYFPVRYKEHLQKNKLEVSLQYQLIEVTTAEILAADIIYENVAHNMRYASYNGNYNSLYPSNGESIYLDGEERASFLSLFSQSPMPSTESELWYEVQQQLSVKVAGSIDKYFIK